MTNTRMELEQNNNGELFELPSEILNEIIHAGSKKESIQIMAKLSQGNSSIYKFFQPDLEKEGVTRLLQYVLQGNLAKAKAIYAVNPKLLFIETTAEEYAAGIDINDKPVHRTIMKSPFRAALGCGDIELLNDMSYYFDKVFDNDSKQNGYQIAYEQWKQEFPDNNIDYPPSYYNFEPLITAIKNDPMIQQTGIISPETQSLLLQFRKDFLPSVVKSGLHFNMNHLIKACEAYIPSWQWGYSQSLFWCQVIGYLERLVTAIDAYTMGHGFDNKQPLDRRFNLVRPTTKEELTYFPLDTNPNFRLGINFGVQGVTDGSRASAIQVGWVNTYLHFKMQANKTINNLKKFGKMLEDFSTLRDDRRAVPPGNGY